MMHFVTFGLLIVGGLNWLLQGAFMWDISQLFGGMESAVARVIYILVGLAAVVEVVMHKKNCKMCGKGTIMKNNPPMGGGNMPPG